MIRVNAEYLAISHLNIIYINMLLIFYLKS